MAPHPVTATAENIPTASALTDRFVDGVQRVFSVDLRSLALFRIALGTVLLGDLLLRLKDLEAHYADAGILPIELLRELYDRPLVSLHVLSGSVEWQATLFGVAIAAAVCLILGYHTRLATVLSWVLLLSLHVRNPYIINSGDQYLLNLLLWSTLLPLGARLSVDARKVEPRSLSIHSLATLGIFLQICLLYFISALTKSGDPWIRDFTAVYYTLNLDAHVTPFGILLSQAPLCFLQLLTIATLLLEFIGPLLILSPIYTTQLRLVAVGSFIAFHAGLQLALEVGIFSAVGAAAWLIFLPSAFWSTIGKRLPLRRRHTWFRSFDTASKHSPAPDTRNSPVHELAAAALILACLLGAADGVGRSISVIDAVGTPLRTIRFTQAWSMFAPTPATDDAWFTMTGYRRDGTLVNVFDHTAEPVTTRPAVVSSMYRGERWRKFLFNGYRLPHWKARRDFLPAYLWRKWHRAHPKDPLERIEIGMIREVTPAPGMPFSTAEEVLITYRPEM